MKKLNDLNYEVLSRPPYSPDLFPITFHLFRNFNNFRKGKIFDNDCQVENAFSDFISSQIPEFFTSGIDKSVRRWENCIENGILIKNVFIL